MFMHAKLGQQQTSQTARAQQNTSSTRRQGSFVFLWCVELSFGKGICKNEHVFMLRGREGIILHLIEVGSQDEKSAPGLTPSWKIFSRIQWDPALVLSVVSPVVHLWSM